MHLVKFFIDLHVKITKIKFGLKFISSFLIILVTIVLLHFSIFRHILILKVSGEEPKPKSTYAEYVRATKYILALCLKHFQEKIFNIFEKSVKRCHKNATHGMVSWRSSATVYIHINTNSIWTIRKRSVLEFLKRKYILDFKKKFIEQKVHTWVLRQM